MSGLASPVPEKNSPEERSAPDFARLRLFIPEPSNTLHRARRERAFPAVRAAIEKCSRRTVLFVDHTAAMSGGEVALLNVVRHLDTARYLPVVVLGSDGPLRERLQQAGIETHLLPLAPNVAQTRKDSLGSRGLLRLAAIGQSLGYARRLAAFMRSRKVDLVHTNSLKADVLGGIAAKIARKPVIWHVHDRIAEDYLPGPAVRLFRLLCRTLPDCVIANSKATLETVQLPAGAHTAVVYSGIDLSAEKLALPNHAIVYAREAPTQTFRIGLVGRIARWKGQHIFLQAAQRIHQQFPSARFQIIGAALFGEEAYAEELQQMTRQLGLSECVEFLGFRADVASLLNELDVLVHASTTGEPFGQVVVEGMAAGKPVVATRGGGIPEIVEDGKTGLLVPMGEAEPMADAVCELLANPQRAKALGAAGRQRVEAVFTIEKTVETLTNVYDQVCARCGI